MKAYTFIQELAIRCMENGTPILHSMLLHHNRRGMKMHSSLAEILGTLKDIQQVVQVVDLHFHFAKSIHKGD